jgi:hypothetical protein
LNIAPFPLDPLRGEVLRNGTQCPGTFTTTAQYLIMTDDLGPEHESCG